MSSNIGKLMVDMLVESAEWIMVRGVICELCVVSVLEL